LAVAPPAGDRQPATEDSGPANGGRMGARSLVHPAEPAALSRAGRVQRPSVSLTAPRDHQGVLAGLVPAGAVVAGALAGLVVLLWAAGPNVVQITRQRLAGERSVRSSGSVLLESLTIESTGHLRVSAGRSVMIGNRFAILPGGSLTVELEQPPPQPRPEDG
jgi:hypothetical protein